MKNKMHFSLVILTWMAWLVPIGLEGQIKEEFDFRTLIFAGQDQYHYKVIPDAIKGLENLSEKYQFKMEWTLSRDIFGSEDLFSYDVVVFLNANGTALDLAHRENFQRYIRNGGGFVGVHAVTGVDDWEWFNGLIGRRFGFHPPQQYAVLEVIDKNFPATMHLPDRIFWTDEWYSFGDAFTDSMHVLITVDEATYHPEGRYRHEGKPGMGEFHPISWYQEYDGGRSFYTALGHYKELYQDPGFMLHIAGGMLWAATGMGIK